MISRLLKKIGVEKKEAKRIYEILGVKGIFSLIKASVLKKPVLVKVCSPSIKHTFHLRVPSTDVITYEQVILNREYEFDVNRKPGIILDAGANIGLTSIYFSNTFPEATIFALEPEKSNFDLMKENVRRYKNITPIHGALWDKQEEIDLIDPGQGHWGFMVEKDADHNRLAAEISHRVQGWTVDQIIKKNHIESIDILKMDIEGAELEVFSDPSSWIGDVGALIVELHERMKPGIEKTFAIATSAFENRWTKGDSVFVTRKNASIRTPKLKV